MKKILKQKFFWIGVLLLLVSIGVGIGNGFRQNSVKSVDVFMDAVMSGDLEKVVKAIAPSQTEKMETLSFTVSTIANLMGITENTESKDMKMMQGTLVRDDEGKPVSIQVMMLTPGTDKIRVSTQKLKLLEEDGKIYLDMLGF